MTDVTVRSSNGSALALLPLAADGSVTLTEAIEVVIWCERGVELRRKLDRLEAFTSREICWNLYGDGIARLSDGTPLTDEIMEAWGWVRHGDGWRSPPPSAGDDRTLVHSDGLCRPEGSR